MLSFLQYVVALVILGQAEASPTDLPKRPDWLGIGLALAAFALASRVVGALLARVVHDREDDGTPLLFFVVGAGRVAALGVFYAVALPLRGALVPQFLGVSEWFLVPTLLRMTPYLALVAALAWGLHPAALAARIGARTAGRAVVAEFGGALLPLASIFTLVALQDALRLAVRSPESPIGSAVMQVARLPATSALLWLSLLFVVLLFMPFGLRLFLRAKPLPDGPLRRRLESYAGRVGFRCRDILVWPTDDVLNAMVVGALPLFRYAFVTNALLKTLDEDQIEAVFAHEAGHARRGHVPLFFGFTVVLALVQFVPGADFVLGGALSWMPPFARNIALFVLWFGMVFGWVSRRFEQEADVYALDTLTPRSADAAEAAHPFVQALERIGAEVGAIREVTGWRHFSIAERVAFARSYAADADVRRAWRRSIFVLRATLLVMIFGFVLAAAVRVPGELREGAARRQMGIQPESVYLLELNSGLAATPPEERAARLERAAVFATVSGRFDVAARWLRESVALDRNRPDTLRTYAQLLEKTGRPLGAKLAWQELADLPDAPPKVREEAKRNASAQTPR